MVATTRLTARESRLLSAITSMKRAWIDRKPFSNREQPAWDLVGQAIADLDELRAEMLDGEDHRDPEIVNGVDCDGRTFGR